jgi:hypothetical protein
MHKVLLAILILYGGSILANAGTLVLDPSAIVRYHIPVANPPREWNTLEFNDSAWMTGTNGIGYDLNSAVDGRNGLAGWLRFDTAVLGFDSGPNNITLTAMRTQADANGRQGGCAKFDGTGAHRVRPTFPSGIPINDSRFNVSMWINPKFPFNNEWPVSKTCFHCFPSWIWGGTLKSPWASRLSTSKFRASSPKR